MFVSAYQKEIYLRHLRLADGGGWGGRGKVHRFHQGPPLGYGGAKAIQIRDLDSIRREYGESKRVSRVVRSGGRRSAASCYGPPDDGVGRPAEEAFIR